MHEQRFRVYAPRSVYHGHLGTVAERSGRNSIKLDLDDPPEGWPSCIWFCEAELSEEADG